MRPGTATAQPAHVAVFPRGQAPAMAISTYDLPERLALAGPEDNARGVLCNGALAAVSRLLDPGAAEVCRSASGERRFIEFFSYPITSFLRLSFTAAELLRSKLGGYDAAFRTLGKQAVDDFLSTAVGRTLRSLEGKRPWRPLTAMPAAYRTVLNHGERDVELLGEGRCLMKMRRDFMPPPYHEGVLSSVLGSLGATRIQVLGKRVGALDADYEITWD
jgi:uncharacterized protein (TIGR02265 family)